jgi:KaiC/GvpD/RAD55 family RecA-like ATPase
LIALEAMKEPHGRERPNSDQSLLPPELLRFLNRSSYALLIKGGAATGKTILALSILKEVGATGNYLYLSTRVSPSELFENHPWLTDFTKIKPSDLEDSAEVQRGARFVDARLDEPVPFFERITDELMDVRAPTIFVDSWDPIGVMMEEDALISNTKVLQTWRERARAKIIILMEDSDNTTFDSLVDGVVTLDKYYEDGRIVRLMQLSKLSGVKVNRPSHLFTLDGGVFQSFRTYSPLEIAAQKPVGWTWEKRVRSTGYPELDSMFDKTLPSGTIMSLNLADGVNVGMVLLLLSGIIGRGAPRSRAMFFKPFEGVGLGQARAALGDVIPIQQVVPLGRGEGSEGWAEALRDQVRQQKDGGHGKKVVALFGSEFLLGAGGEDGRALLLELMKSEIDLSVIVSASETSLQSAARVSDVSLKLSEKNGSPILQAQLPWTEYFVMSVMANHNHTTVGLVPMV